MMKMMKMRATPFLVVAFLLATVFSCKKDDNSNNDDSGSGSGDDGQTQTEVQVTAEYTNGGTSGAMYKTDVTLDEDGLSSGKTVDGLGESHYSEVTLTLSNAEEGQDYRYRYSLVNTGSIGDRLFGRKEDSQPLITERWYNFGSGNASSLYFYGQEVGTVKIRVDVSKVGDDDNVLATKNLRFDVVDGDTDNADFAFYKDANDTEYDYSVATIATQSGGDSEIYPTEEHVVWNSPIALTIVSGKTASIDKKYGSFRFIPRISVTPPNDVKEGDPSKEYSISYTDISEDKGMADYYEMDLLDDNKIVNATGGTVKTVDSAPVIEPGTWKNFVATTLKNGGPLVWAFDQATGDKKNVTGAADPKNRVAKNWLFKLTKNIGTTANATFKLRFKLLKHVTKSNSGEMINAYIQKTKDATITITAGYDKLPASTESGS